MARARPAIYRFRGIFALPRPSMTMTDDYLQNVNKCAHRLFSHFPFLFSSVPRYMDGDGMVILCPKTVFFRKYIEHSPRFLSVPHCNVRQRHRSLQLSVILFPYSCCLCIVIWRLFFALENRRNGLVRRRVHCVYSSQANSQRPRRAKNVVQVMKMRTLSFECFIFCRRFLSK